jgi:uncharacterized protein YjbI with pentapeptide repeats
MMTKLSQFFALSFLSCLSSAVLASTYNPDQLADFNLTNVCNTCDLSGAMLYGNHSNAVLVNSNLTGVKGRETFSMTNFSGSNLSSSDWTGANLSYAQMSYIPLVKVNFTGADLSYAHFEGSNTTDAIFDNANLLNATITDEQLSVAASYCGAVLPNGTKKNC